MFREPIQRELRCLRQHWYDEKLRIQLCYFSKLDRRHLASSYLHNDISFCIPLSSASFAQELWWLRSIILIVASSPMKLGACWILLPWYFGSLPLALRCFSHAIIHSPPPRWGGFGSCTITASWLRLTDMVTTLSMEAL